MLADGPFLLQFVVGGGNGEITIGLLYLGEKRDHHHHQTIAKNLEISDFVTYLPLRNCNSITQQYFIETYPRPPSVNWA